jgi:hypothetical protein
MFKRFVTFFFATTLSLWFVQTYSPLHPNDASVPDRVLAEVVGHATSRVCLQYDPDYENLSFDCWSRYANHDNDCDWKICSAGQSCGEGKLYSGLWKETWIAVERTSTSIAWRQKSSPCIGIVMCNSENFDPMKNCLAASLSEFPNGTVVDHTSLGCKTPTVDVVPGGCSECFAGDPLPFHADVEFWTWYEQVECNP